MPQGSRVEDGRIIREPKKPQSKHSPKGVVDGLHRANDHGVLDLGALQDLEDTAATPPEIRRRDLAEIFSQLDHPEYRQWAQTVTGARDGMLRDDPVEGSTIDAIQRRIAQWAREAETMGGARVAHEPLLEIFHALDYLRTERGNLRESLRHAINELTRTRELAVQDRNAMVQPQFAIQDRAEVSDTFRIR